ncbi:phage tail protein [Bordetella avium]|uniref:phage tail protein n=1 Tax=Bordetella avium TaxID=521 RepID=UPI000E69A42F|nr:phage tail protein [Bordetella avium]AZY50086.1 phage tail protein [Bordetella avium]RIQ74579.1 phage tail protein [Bordetella avium]
MKATETFRWRPIGQPAGAVSFRRLVAQFGDGYRQVASDGLNSKTQAWPLQFAGVREEMRQLLEFLDRHAGVRPFFWTPPFGVEGYYEVKEYSITPAGGAAYAVSATFEQVFRP